MLFSHHGTAPPSALQRIISSTVQSHPDEAHRIIEKHLTGAKENEEDAATEPIDITAVTPYRNAWAKVFVLLFFSFAITHLTIMR